MTAKIKGKGFDELDPASIKMVGPGGDEITPYSCDVGGVFFKAKFYQKDAIGIIPEPGRGDIHKIELKGNTSEGAAISLKYSIRIVGPKDS